MHAGAGRAAETAEESTQPLTAPEMLQRLPSPTDTVTVYRMLNTFTELLLIHRIRAKDRSESYAPGAPQPRQAHRHPHFVCDECGTIECLEDRPDPRFVRQVATRSWRISREVSRGAPAWIVSEVHVKAAGGGFRVQGSGFRTKAAQVFSGVAAPCRVGVLARLFAPKCKLGGRIECR